MVYHIYHIIFDIYCKNLGKQGEDNSEDNFGNYLSFKSNKKTNHYIVFISGSIKDYLLHCSNFKLERQFPIHERGCFDPLLPLWQQKFYRSYKYLLFNLFYRIHKIK